MFDYLFKKIKISFLRYYPVGLTIIVLWIFDWLNFPHSTSFTIAPAFGAVMMAVKLSGDVGGFLSACCVIVYAIFFIHDPAKAFLIIISLGFSTIPILSLSKNVSSARATISRLWDIQSRSLGLVVNWGELTEEEKFDAVDDIHSKLTNILTVSRGFHLLAQEKYNVTNKKHIK